MKQQTIALLLALTCTTVILAANEKPLQGNVSFYPNGYVAYHQEKQIELRQQNSWQQFKKQHPDWLAVFDENNGNIERAFGTPISTSGSSATEKAINFIHTDLRPLGISESAYSFKTVTVNDKGSHVIFKETLDGKEVLWSELSIVINNAGDIAMFSVSNHQNAQIPGGNTLSPAAIQAAALASVGAAVEDVTVTPEVAVLPVPGTEGYEYHMVYQVQLHVDEEPFHANYSCLFDAFSGELLYRHNFNCAASNVTISGGIKELPYDPTLTKNFPHTKIVVGATTYYSDATGVASVTSGTSGTFRLEGRYAKCMMDGSSVAANFTSSFVDGSNISWDGNASIDELSAYYHATVQHDYMKTRLPSGFTAMDNPINVYVGVAGTCNAFYDGNLNFYAAGGGCTSAALVGDVIYHEYGHGINYEYYNWLGGNFGNGALGEGYADVWAISHTVNPVLGYGFLGAGSSVRRYDLGPKRYPNDLIGEVHADGEIICGAWWDTYDYIGDMDIMMDIFVKTHDALLDEPDGNEGVLYHNILLEALYADDIDGNLMNGTPWDNQILDAFDRHGISIAWLAELNHSQSHYITSSVTYPVEGVLNLPPDWIDVSSGKVYYRLNNSTAWSFSILSELSAGDYIGVIPAQPMGTIIAYYFKLESASTSAVVTPFKADLSGDAGLPFFTLVDFLRTSEEDFDSKNMGTWSVNAMGTDDASTGDWLIADPNESYTNGSSGTMVQLGDDHTDDPGVKCAVTGNAAIGSSAGTNDVDDGLTTIRSPKFDLSTYTNPAFTFWRVFTNDLGSNPATDAWKVFISDDNGSSWTEIENTLVADNQWRKFAFRVMDYVSNSADVYLLFQAEDAPGNGGARIEALIDDITLYDQGKYEAIPDDSKAANFEIFPNPLSGNKLFLTGIADKSTVVIKDMSGKTVFEKNLTAINGNAVIETGVMSSGIYSVQVNTGTETSVQQLIVR